MANQDQIRVLEDRLHSEWERFVYSAVLEGLKKDGADPELAKILVSSRDDHFVIKCNICYSVATAFSVYAMTGSKPLRSSFPEDLEIQIKGKDLKVRLEGLEKLVQRYIAIGFEQSKMTDEE